MFKLIRQFANAVGVAISPILRRFPGVMAFLNRLNYQLTRLTTMKISNEVLEGLRAAKHWEGDFGINVAGYLTSESGVGEAARANVRALETLYIPYSLNNLKSSSRQEDGTYRHFVRDNPYRFNLIQVNADQVAPVLDKEGSDFFKRKYNIGFWYWELSRFPEEWLYSFQIFNEIWVASSFCQESISRISPVPVIKIPPSVVVNNIKKVERSYFDLKKDSFIFLFAFDFSSVFERKNPLAVIKAFKTAFDPSEDVCLVLKCSNSTRNKGLFGKIMESAKGLNIKLIYEYLQKDEIYALMNLSDCYVSLHRSEGFGFPIAEAMYLKKPVIATGYSANMDFMSEENSFPVKFRLIEIENTQGPYKKGYIWAAPDIDHAAESMRSVYTNRDIAKRKGEKASDDIKANFSPLATGQQIKKRLETIQGSRP